MRRSGLVAGAVVRGGPVSSVERPVGVDRAIRIDRSLRSTAPSGSTGTGADQLHVGMREFSFALDRSSLDPAPATVDVTADNGGEVPHTITFYADAAFTQKVPGADSGSVAAGGSKTFSFTPPDGASELFFRCEIHPTQMTGKITVSG